MTQPYCHCILTRTVLWIAVILGPLALSVSACAAIAKGPDFTNAVSEQVQRISQFREAEKSFSEKVRVGQERYNQKQMNRARIVAAMASQLQSRQQTVVFQPMPAPAADTRRPAGESWTSAAWAALVAGFIGLAYHLKRQNAQNHLPKHAQAISKEPPEPQHAPVSKEDETFFCKTSTANASGRYTKTGFLVLKGSVGPKADGTSFEGNLAEMRVKLLKSGVMREESASVIFREDHLFPTPSMALSALIGHRANGWLEWKTKDGVALETLERLQ